jgi:hypothetical protein
MPELVRNAMLAPLVIAAAALLVAVVCTVVLVVAYLLAQASMLLGFGNSEYSDVISVLMR